MYQALYRKYRPTNFDEVVDQDIIIETLKNSIKNDKISHAYLFTGPRGTGKTSIAKIFAKTVNCEHLKNLCPCNNCVSCTQINNNQSVDIIEIDAASNNGVDEIRTLKDKINIMPNTSKYKVYIIDEVHMLTPGAFNALLKTLEEPPYYVIFILATTEPQKIPLTILSRCQRYDFKKISQTKIVQRLEKICLNENVSIDKTALEEIARISDGGMRDSISILDQAISYKTNDITLDDIHTINGTITQDDLKKFIQCILQNDIEKVFDLLDYYNNNGKNLNRILEEMIVYLRNLLLYKLVPNYLIKNDIDVEPYKNLNANIDSKKIYALISNFNNLSLKLKASTNSKILFEMEILNNMDTKNISREIKSDSSDLPLDKIEDNKIEDNKEQIISYYKKMDVIKKIRISNVLSQLNKSEIKNLSKVPDKLLKYLVNKKYGKLMSLLIDGKIKAASSDGAVYVYEYSNSSIIFNNNVLILEQIVNKICNKYYKLISVSNDEWQMIKNEFNNKIKKYDYEDETFDLSEMYKSAKKLIKDDMYDFDDILEFTMEDI